MNLKIKDSNILPMQKCISGEEIKNLSDLELLAIILGTGSKRSDVMDTSSNILKGSGGLIGVYNSGIREITNHAGVGIKKAIKIHASFELGRRVITNRRKIKQIDSPELVWKLLLPELAGLEKEEFFVLIMNNKNHLLKKSLISIGTITESIVHPREVFRDAIREGGSALIVSHNHPSGILTPSMEDIKTTGRIAEAGILIGIPLLDHVIISNYSYYSMKENGDF